MSRGVFGRKLFITLFIYISLQFHILYKTFMQAVSSLSIRFGLD